MTWPTVRSEFTRLRVGTFAGPAGVFRQRTELTKTQRDLLTKLRVTPPKQVIELVAASSSTPTATPGVL